MGQILSYIQYYITPDFSTKENFRNMDEEFFQKLSSVLTQEELTQKVKDADLSEVSEALAKCVEEYLDKQEVITREKFGPRWQTYAEPSSVEQQHQALKTHIEQEILRVQNSKNLGDFLKDLVAHFAINEFGGFEFVDVRSEENRQLSAIEYLSTNQEKFQAEVMASVLSSGKHPVLAVFPEFDHDPEKVKQALTERKQTDYTYEVLDRNVYKGNAGKSYLSRGFECEVLEDIKLKEGMSDSQKKQFDTHKEKFAVLLILGGPFKVKTPFIFYHGSSMGTFKDYEKNVEEHKFVRFLENHLRKSFDEVIIGGDFNMTLQSQAEDKGTQEYILHPLKFEGEDHLANIANDMKLISNGKPTTKRIRSFDSMTNCQSLNKFKVGSKTAVTDHLMISTEDSFEALTQTLPEGKVTVPLITGDIQKDHLTDHGVYIITITLRGETVKFVLFNVLSKAASAKSAFKSDLTAEQKEEGKDKFADAFTLLTNTLMYQ